MRERDSMGQVRINVNPFFFRIKNSSELKTKISIYNDLFTLQLEELPAVVRDLSLGKTTWSDVEAKYPKFEQQESTEA